MQPTPEINDVVVVRKADGCEIKAAPKDATPSSDIIVFSGQRVGRPGELMVHRAVRKIQDEKGIWHFITQGDANLVADLGDVKKLRLSVKS